MKIKEIFLMLFIIAAGIFFYHAQTGKLDWDWDWGEELFFDYDEFKYTESQDYYYLELFFQGFFADLSFFQYG